MPSSRAWPLLNWSKTDILIFSHAAKRQLPENKHCADCLASSPQWASVNLGVFVCIACSGIHRKLGTHISQVRSIALDTWTPSQIARFQKFGNARAAKYFEACLPSDFRRPAAADSMQMERFIRDKYEKKRYITVENGGLGGEAPSTGRLRSSYQAKGNAPSPSRGWGSQSAEAYDDVARRRGTAMPLSYGDRFRAGAPASNGSSRIPGTNTRNFNAGRIIGPKIRQGNAIQRAHTLKELLNMGFPPELATRAVEASAGDLQRAVDWVLARPESSGATSTTPVNLPHSPPEKDLLDFSAPNPTPPAAPPALNSPGNTASAVVGGQRSSPRPDKTRTAETENFADFADFGEFESALPAAQTSQGTLSTPASTATLGSSIARLYAKDPRSPANGSVGTANSAHHAPSIPVMAPIGHALNKPVQTPPNTATSSTAIPSFKWPDEGKSTPVSRDSTQKAAEQAKSTSLIQGSVASSREANGRVLPPPPPLPPLLRTQEMTAGTDDVPPPPDCPPPANDDVTGPVPLTDVSNSDVETGPREDTNSPADKEEPKSVPLDSKTTAPEEEDPFAALSMFAMSSAKSQKKTAKKQTEPALVPITNAVSSERAAAAHDQGTIDLDSLLG